MTPLPTHPHKSNSKWKVHFKEGLSHEHVDFHHEICRKRLSVALLLLERLAAGGSPCKEAPFCPLALHQIVETHWMVFMDFFSYWFELFMSILLWQREEGAWRQHGLTSTW